MKSIMRRSATLWILVSSFPEINPPGYHRISLREEPHLRFDVVLRGVKTSDASGGPLSPVLLTSGGVHPRLRILKAQASRTKNRQTWAIHHMQIDHRRPDIFESSRGHSKFTGTQQVHGDTASSRGHSKFTGTQQDLTQRTFVARISVLHPATGLSPIYAVLRGTREVLDASPDSPAR
jgi:hypothetical protein